MPQSSEDKPPMDMEVLEALDALIAKVGAAPGTADSKLVREMMHTALKYARDNADTGELKLISRSFKELRYAQKVFRPFRGVRKVSVFGSARTPPEHPHYKAAEQFSREISKSGWMVITGAGDGIMRAGHGGAGREASFGVAIRLPFETNANEYILGDKKLVMFRYFFTRKLMFVSQSDAVVLFPGGFGTHDEGFEVLTLVQTGKALPVPIVMVDAPGDDYWKKWEQYIHEHLLEKGMISPDDLNLFLVTDDISQAVRHVLQFYRNYHSQRYVRDTLVIRMLRPLTDAQVGMLNEEFSVLVKEGSITQGPALKAETQYLELPRLSWVSNKRHYGLQRLLIDRINEYDALNAGDGQDP